MKKKLKKGVTQKKRKGCDKSGYGEKGERAKKR